MKAWEIATLLFDEAIRVEKIIWLSGNTGDQTDDFKDFFNDEDPADIAKLLNVRKRPLEEALSEGHEEFSAWLCREGRYGFLVQCATPVPRDFSKDGSSYSWSWGYATLQWFYTEQIDEDFVLAVLAWKKLRRAKELKAEKKKKKS